MHPSANYAHETCDVKDTQDGVAIAIEVITNAQPFGGVILYSIFYILNVPNKGCKLLKNSNKRREPASCMNARPKCIHK